MLRWLLFFFTKKWQIFYSSQWMFGIITVTLIAVSNSCAKIQTAPDSNSCISLTHQSDTCPYGLLASQWPTLSRHKTLNFPVESPCVCACAYVRSRVYTRSHARMYTHRHIYGMNQEKHPIFFHTMTDTLTSQTSDPSSWITLYMYLLGEFSISDLRAHISLESEFPMRYDKLISLF